MKTRKTKVTRNTEGLRNVLFDLIDDVRAGNFEEKRAKAINSTASSILKTVKLEMDYKRMLISATKKGHYKIASSNKPLALNRGS